MESTIRTRFAGLLAARRGDPRTAAAGIAALITALAFCASDVIARSFPFGPNTRNTNDLGNQYVPMHSHLWDLLHGKASGGLLMNWQSGFGASFLPDYGTYVSSPFALLVALFPRDEIDLAVYVITALKTATAAGMMTFLLLTLRPGNRWTAALLGMSYALCGWSVADAAYNMMWLDGLIALPMLCLVTEWLRAPQNASQNTAQHSLLPRPQLLVPAVLLVTLTWWANFYTAYMATAGAALFLLLRLTLARPSRRETLTTLARAALTVVLGMGLAAPLITVIYFGTKHASPGRFKGFVPSPADDVLARLMPTTYGFGTPGLYVGTTALLLALALPFHRKAPLNVRIGWPALAVLMFLSMQWPPTQLAWHAFTTPQGSGYREAFVLCAFLVIAAWHALSYGVPDLRAFGAATVILVLMAAGASRSDLVRPFVLPILAFVVLCVLAAFLLLRRERWVVFAVVLLVTAQVGEATGTTAVNTRLRLAHLDDYAPWGDRQQAQSEAIASVTDWPVYRTDPGREMTVGNDPMVVRGQGAQYYSSHTSDVLYRLMTALGDGWTSAGRNIQSLDNAVTDTVFSIGARVHSPPDPHQNWFPQDGTKDTVTRQEVPPLVTVRAGTPKSVADFGADPYRNQELLLGARVYTQPRLTVRMSDGTTPGHSRVRPGFYIGRHRTTVTVSCPAGNEVYLWMPYYAGTAKVTGSDLIGRYRSDTSTKIAAMQRLGHVPASGKVRISLAPTTWSFVPDNSVGCLDTAKLRTAAEHLKATGATKVSVSDGTLKAELPAGSKGTAVISAPRIAGWRCAVDGAPQRPAAEYYGLLAVPLDGKATSLTCTFHTPGLRLGLAAGGVSLLGLVLVLLAIGLRGRRRTPDGEGEGRPHSHELLQKA